MSYLSLLKHRCTIRRLIEGDIDGMPTASWVVTSTSVRCFLDLNFVRKGKDPMWSPESGRPADRSGVLFVSGKTDIRPGDRIVMTKGPQGTFEASAGVDEAWKPESRHHIELYVNEVPGPLARASQQ